MQHYERDIQFDIVLPDVKASSKKQVFMALGDALEKHLKVPASMICEELMRKEEKGSSALSGGVAIPELQLGNMMKPLTIFARLNAPVDFNAADGSLVDLVCFVISPTREGPLYLRRLSRISRLFKNEGLCERLRETADEDSIRTLIYNPDGWMLAA